MLRSCDYDGLFIAVPELLGGLSVSFYCTLQVLFYIAFSYKTVSFDAILFLIYMVSKLVYPNCTQDEILPKVVTRRNF